MTNEQDWAFYRLIPMLIEEGVIEVAPEFQDHEVGQRILDIAAEDGVSIDATVYHDNTCESCRSEAAR